MKQAVINAFAFNLVYATKALEDVAGEKLCDQPAGLKNHPAWILGHLALASDNGCKMLGGESKGLPDGEKLFNMGTAPVSDVSQYPDKAVLLGALEDGHARLAKAYEGADESTLAQPMPNEQVRSMFPTVGDFVLFIMTGHEGMHLGQLMAWRQAQGMAPALGI